MFNIFLVAGKNCGGMTGVIESFCKNINYGYCKSNFLQILFKKLFTFLSRITKTLFFFY